MHCFPRLFKQNILLLILLLTDKTCSRKFREESRVTPWNFNALDHLIKIRTYINLCSIISEEKYIEDYL
uniref:Uncharacterized protein n=1 Tax=Pristhesancus plagipennis TaxID=1955184 RepID=A0A2K8JMB9_PRIPG|nr:secreted hypothetical protein [Pristhesancus plagipennis]